MATTKSILRAARNSPGGARPTSPPQGTGTYFGAMSPLAMNLADQHGYANAYSGFLPRPPVTFTQGAFGPFSPILPVPVDEPDPSTGRAEPRREQFQPGWNLPVGTPGSEGLKLASFSTLRTLADLYSVARACIQLRKSEIRGLEWDIMPTQEAAKANRGNKKWFRDFGERRAKAKKFFRRPDPDYYSWNTFLDAFLEEVFVFDALSLYLRPKRGKGMGKGVLGSDLDSLNLVNGPTIRPLYDMHGASPLPPAPAYQQYLYGVPRSDFIKMMTEMDIEESGLRDSQLDAFRGDQLLYIPMVPRRWTPYGFPPIERAMIPVMSGLQKQGWQLDYFREGTVPSVYMSPGDENMTPNQIRELQDALNAFAGDPAWHHKIIVLPPGTRVEPQRDTQLADQFDEVVMTQVCMAFDIMPMELGIAPKVSTSMSPGASHQMAKMAADVGERKATKPTLMFISDIMNNILQFTCGQEDMLFVFEGLEAEEDQMMLTELLSNQVKVGLRSVDEAREELNLQPWGLPETSGPVYGTATGVMPFGMQLSTVGGQPTPVAPGQQALPGVPPKVPAVAIGSGQAAPSAASPHAETPGHAAAQGHAGVSGKPAGKPATAPAAPPAAIGAKVDEPGLLKAAANELDALSRHVKKGRQISSWVPRNIAPDALARISQHMAEGLEIDDAIKVVRATRRVISLNGQESWMNAAVPASAAGGGGRSPVRHLGDGTEVPGGVPDSTAGGEPPRWIPSQPPNGYMGGYYDRSDRTHAHHPDGGRDDQVPVGVRHDVDVTARPARYPSPPPGQWPHGGHGTQQPRGGAVPGNANERGRAPGVGDVPRRMVGSASKAACVAACLVVRAVNTGRVLMLQRALGPTNCPCGMPLAWGLDGGDWWSHADGSISHDDGRSVSDLVGTEHDRAAGMWEFPGGCLESGEQPRSAAVREWQEETGIVLPVGRFIGSWQVDGGHFQGFIYEVNSEDDIPIFDGRDRVTNPDDPDGDVVEALAWWIPADLTDNPSVRPELVSSLDAVLPALGNGNGVDPAVIAEQMSKNFQPEGYRWVYDTTWAGPQEVPLAEVDFDDEKSWAAHHEPDAVARFVERLRTGDYVKPAVVVRAPGNDRVVVVDGHHRVLAERSLQRPVSAYVGTTSSATGPWTETHSFQIHHGADPANKNVD